MFKCQKDTEHILLPGKDMKRGWAVQKIVMHGFGNRVGAAKNRHAIGMNLGLGYGELNVRNCGISDYRKMIELLRGKA
ncbi:hypothetical protein KS4_33210 [Poriferisphaera corsica]|uniref:Uncharacterized protein n=1 Tax=Poriferisphaera corsica TaxID=2528020 RepID=A0A517YYE0_9BACT|nr:hypothetical protein [Poriferisphaera corsica]QDU35240.1 hypothetical protein KS4_33210 [Poriferisphaera corsica]